MDEEVVEAAEHDHGASEPEGNAMQFAFHQLFILAHFDSDVAKDRAPNAGAQDREQREQSVIHAHDAGGNPDEMPHDRQQA